MKRIILISAILLMTNFVFCQSKKAEITIQTSAECNMCKERIEKALSYEKGIYSSNLDLQTKKVHVVYNPQKTNPDKIRLAISKLGYQADDIKADPFAYEKLPECCKVGGSSKHKE